MLTNPKKSLQAGRAHPLQLSGRDPGVSELPSPTGSIDTNNKDDSIQWPYDSWLTLDQHPWGFLLRFYTFPCCVFPLNASTANNPVSKIPLLSKILPFQPFCRISRSSLSAVWAKVMQQGCMRAGTWSPGHRCRIPGFIWVHRLYTPCYLPTSGSLFA